MQMPKKKHHIRKRLNYWTLEQSSQPPEAPKPVLSPGESDPLRQPPARCRLPG